MKIWRLKAPGGSSAARWMQWRTNTSGLRIPRFAVSSGVTAAFAVTLILLLGVAAAYAQLPEPKAHTFPLGGNREAVWVVAQLHILFAAFILGAPIFVTVCEILGWKKGDTRYERLAREVTSVTAVLYSMIALTGGFFIFVLLATYPRLTEWLVNHFFAIFALIYPALFIAETIILYLYWYTWDALQGAKM